jgi:hypothetical protein
MAVEHMEEERAAETQDNSEEEGPDNQLLVPWDRAYALAHLEKKQTQGNKEKQDHP